MIVVWILGAGNDTRVPAGETRVPSRARTDLWILTSLSVTPMPELTTNDPLPRLIVAGTVKCAGRSALNISRQT